MARISHHFVYGMGSILDLVPHGGFSYVGRGIDLKRTETEALEQDWQRVAQDFRAAFDKTIKTIEQQAPAQQMR